MSLNYLQNEIGDSGNFEFLIGYTSWSENMGSKKLPLMLVVS
jgi:hypothetical protein